MDQDRNTKAKAATRKAFPAPLLSWKSGQKKQREIYYSFAPVCFIPANSTESGGAAFPDTRR